jgi:hypothetical protein
MKRKILSIIKKIFIAIGMIILLFLIWIDYNSKKSYQLYDSKYSTKLVTKAVVDSMNNNLFHNNSTFYIEPALLKTDTGRFSMNLVVFDKDGQIIDKDVCWAYFPDKLLEMVKTYKFREKRHPTEFIMQDYLQNVKDKNGQPVGFDSLDLKKINIIFYWVCFAHKGYKKYKVVDFCDYVKSDTSMNLIIINADYVADFNY